MVLALELAVTMSKNERRTTTGIKRTFIACSDGILEMTSINLSAQRGEQPFELVWNGKRGLGGGLGFESFVLLAGRWCRLCDHRRRR